MLKHTTNKTIIATLTIFLSSLSMSFILCGHGEHESDGGDNLDTCIPSSDSEIEEPKNLADDMTIIITKSGTQPMEISGLR